MDIYYKNEKIDNLNDLRSKTHKWEEGKSAATLGRFVFEHDGIEQIESVVSNIVKSTNFSFRWSPNIAIFEHESKFDKYGKGRIHDLALRDSDNRIFVGVEAKVVEPFDSRDIQSAYLSGLMRRAKGDCSNITSRIESLIRRNNFRQFKKEDLSLKYQLLFSTIGTACEDAECCIFLVLVFKTSLYDEVAGTENYHDYQKFMNAITSKRISLDMDMREVEVFADEKSENKKTIYAAYEYIEAADWNN